MFKLIIDFFLWVNGVVFFSEEKRLKREQAKVDRLIKDVEAAIADIEAKLDEEG